MKTVPELKIKLSIAEQSHLLKLFVALVDEHRVMAHIDYVDFWNLLSISRRIQNAQVGHYYSNSFKALPGKYIFKVDLNEWRTISEIFKISQSFLATHPYYENLFRIIYIEFEKQASKYIIRTTVNNFTNHLN